MSDVPDRWAIEGTEVHQRLLWTPKVKSRAHTTFQGKLRTYTPKETVAAERGLRLQWNQPLVTGDVEVVIALANEWVDVTVSEVSPGKHKLLRRGDIDNYAKLVLDALNGRAWTDDRFIDVLHVEKL